MDDIVAMVGIVGMVVFGVVSVLKGLRPRLSTGPDGVEVRADDDAA